MTTTDAPAEEDLRAGPDVVHRGGPEANRARAAERKLAVKAAKQRILGPVAGRLAVASLLQFLASLAAVAPFILVVELARGLLAGNADEGRTWALAVWALALLGVRGLCSAAALTWSHLTDADHQLSLRELLTRTLSRVPLGWFSERSSGAVKKALQDDVHTLHYLIAHARLDLVSAITVPTASLVYLFSVDWRLALILVVPLIGYLFAYARMMADHGESVMGQYTAWEQRVNAAVVEFVDGIVRTFGQAGRAHRRFQDAVDGFSTFFATWAGPMTRLEAATNVLLNPAFLLLVTMTAGTGMVALGWAEPVTLLPFVLVGLGSTILTIGYAAQSARQASDAAVRLTELLATDELSVSPHPQAPAAGGAVVVFDHVAFDHVAFAYREGRPVLHDVGFTLRPGAITALVGPSGSGKSTLAKLLPRFYDVTEGSISVGGVDVRAMDPAQLYRMVGFVFQDVRLIRGSIRENIALGRPDASDAQIQAVAEAAQLHERILQLPAGYDAEVGVDVRLSGGEAQRLSIARALLADPPILLLDEATAFADPESEAAIQDALAHLVAGRTVLVIAHRLHTVVDVDEILVLDAGRLVEQGTHAQLLEARGLYRELWDANEQAAQALAGEEDAR